MVDLSQFRINADNEGICERYADLWDGAGSKKSLIDLALSGQGADFLCDGISKGWGISPDEIVRRFGRYINGGYVYRDESGYTSTMYCKFVGNIDVDTTLLLLIDCDVVLNVPDWMVVDVYACGETNLSIVGGGRVRLVAYGDISSVNVESVDGDCVFKRIQKRNWSRG